MKNAKISNQTIRRLPKYLRKLNELKSDGNDRVSSSQLGEQLGLTSSQIRQDLNHFGEFGQQGYGYNIKTLREQIIIILGLDRNFTAVLVGTGNIGQALINHFDFGQIGIQLVSAFDVDPAIVGTQLDDIEIYDMSELKRVIVELKPDIAILCVPAVYANETTRDLVDAGIMAIWNFTSIELEISQSEVIVEDINFSDSLMALSYYLAKHIDAVQRKIKRCEVQE